MQPKILEEVFDRKTLEDINNKIYDLQVFKRHTCDFDNHEFFRHGKHNMFKDLHDSLTEKACEIFGEKVKPSYNYLSMYWNKGFCPEHTDRPQCKYTIDVCIAQRKPWGIFVEDKEYFLEENQALCYSGTDQKHRRNKIDPLNFCWLIFFHFVPENFEGCLD